MRHEKKRMQVRPSWKDAFAKAITSLSRSAPTIIGIILLIGLLKTVTSQELIASLFSNSPILDSIIGSIAGSIMTGNAMTSYVIGGELLTSEVSLVAVTAFIVSWTTVGIIQYPAEKEQLGKQFALIRNFLSFILSFLVAIVTVAVVSII
ncbi:MAG: hypothetical protein ACOCU6_02075 [Nanoarchaeota archaeon]